jgi:hypothetical protein
MRQTNSVGIRTSKSSMRIPIMSLLRMRESKTLTEGVANNRRNKTTVCMKALSRDVRAID